MSEATMRLTAPSSHLPEWHQALNIAVENYQSTRSWYEQNQVSPSAEQDINAAAGEIEKLIRQYGVLMVLTLLDEIDELHEHQKAVASHFQCGYDDGHSRGLNCGKLYKADDQMRQHSVACVKAYMEEQNKG